MSRNICPACQKEAMSMSTKLKKLMFTTGKNISCEQCEQKLIVGRTSGVLLVIPGIGFAKVAESFMGLPTWAALVAAIVVFTPIYVYWVKFSLPSNKHEGIEW